jgi:lipid A 3-O-deacylase
MIPGMQANMPDMRATAYSLRGRIVLLTAALLLVGIGPAHADVPPAADPLDRMEFDFDSGALYSVGSRASPLDYTFLPQIFTLKTGAFMRRELGSGTLVVRNRFSLLIEPIVRGPETHFVGATAAPSIEWWNSARTFSTFFSIGGGFGWMDSQGYSVPGGQGQDFNFTWFMSAGLRFQLTERLSAATGLYFQHVSNGGLDSVNPGVDALGPTIGIGWRF